MAQLRADLASSRESAEALRRDLRTTQADGEGRARERDESTRNLRNELRDADETIGCVRHFATRPGELCTAIAHTCCPSPVQSTPATAAVAAGPWAAACALRRALRRAIRCAIGTRSPGQEAGQYRSGEYARGCEEGGGAERDAQGQGGVSPSAGGGAAGGARCACGGACRH